MGNLITKDKFAPKSSKFTFRVVLNPILSYGNKYLNSIGRRVSETDGRNMRGCV